jgi:uncharacterized protein
MVIVYGRRRVGKSTLIKQWGGRSKLPFFYWESPRMTADNVRASLVREVLRWAGEPEAVANDRSQAGDWLSVFRLIRRVVGRRACVIAIDEFPWAVEADPGLPSLLKNAWDNVFADTRIKLLIAGSHISAMEKLLLQDAPLYGRMDGKLHVRPFTLPQLADMLPRYSEEKRLAVYAILGGVPDYLRRWDDRRDLMPNIRELLLADTSPFRNEHQVLISDVLRRDSPDYEAVLSAVGHGLHELDDIALESGVPGGKARAASVLTTLEEVRMIERRVRASVRPELHTQARYARYHLADPLLRFYYRFIAPQRSRIALELYDEIVPVFQQQLRAFVGYAFEAQCREWTLLQARNRGLPLSPDFIGSDWSKAHQADVVAISWRDRKVLIGEAKWGDHAVNASQWRDFLASADGVMERLHLADASSRRSGSELPAWRRHLVVFARRGVTTEVQQQMTSLNAQLVTFPQLVQDLASLPTRKMR